MCRVTATSQFDAATLEVRPTVLILRSSRRHQEALGKYLGAVSIFLLMTAGIMIGIRVVL